MIEDGALGRYTHRPSPLSCYVVSSRCQRGGIGAIAAQERLLSRQ